MTDNITEEKKVHRVGWWRSLYYYLDWSYNSDHDIPTEKDVLKKQVLMKQINLSKLKFKKVKVDMKKPIPFDLQKIKPNERHVPLPLVNLNTITPCNTPSCNTPSNIPCTTPSCNTPSCNTPSCNTPSIHIKRGTRYNNNLP